MGAPDTPLLQRHRLTVDDYHRLAEAGMLAPDARVELIDGEIIDMAPQRSRHAFAVNLLFRRLVLALDDRATVHAQTPLVLPGHSEPEPDLLVLRQRADRYLRRHPEPEDVLLLIEVSDTSLRYDREVKVPLYARHGVAEIWLFDLEAARLRRYRSPTTGGEYAEQQVLEAPPALALPGLDGIMLDLSGIFDRG